MIYSTYSSRLNWYDAANPNNQTKNPAIALDAIRQCLQIHRGDTQSASDFPVFRSRAIIVRRKNHALISSKTERPAVRFPSGTFVSGSNDEPAGGNPRWDSANNSNVGLLAHHSPRIFPLAQLHPGQRVLKP